VFSHKNQALWSFFAILRLRSGDKIVRKSLRFSKNPRHQRSI